MPAGEKGIIKSVESNQEMEKLDFALAGEHANLVLNGVDIMKITIGSVVCDIEQPIRAVTRLQARWKILYYRPLSKLCLFNL